MKFYGNYSCGLAAYGHDKMMEKNLMLLTKNDA
jgi:hypothetical protein